MRRRRSCRVVLTQVMRVLESNTVTNILFWGSRKGMIAQMKRVFLSGLVACMAVGMMAQGALAQSADECTCLIPPGPEGQSLGSIESVEGQVLVSQNAGFDSATAGQPVLRGTRIIVGPQSQAVLNLGTDCRRTIEENQDVELDPLDGNICVKIIDSTTGQVATQGNPYILPLAVAAGVGVVALVASSVSD